MIKVYGGGDDHVVVDVEAASGGDETTLHFACELDAEVSLLVGEPQRGLVVRMAYERDGVWSGSIQQVDDKVPLPPWGVSIRGGDCPYSVTVYIDCPTGTPVRRATLETVSTRRQRHREDAERAFEVMRIKRGTMEQDYELERLRAVQRAAVDVMQALTPTPPHLLEQAKQALEVLALVLDIPPIPVPAPTDEGLRGALRAAKTLEDAAEKSVVAVYRASLASPAHLKVSDDWVAEAFAGLGQLPRRSMTYPVTVQAIGHDDANEGSFWPARRRGDADKGWVAVRPVGERYGGKTYLGVYLGDIATSVGCAYHEESGVLFPRVGMHNPAIYVPDLDEVIFGHSSWWGRIKGPEDVAQITDADINSVFYVRMLKSLQATREQCPHDEGPSHEPR